MDLKKRSPRMQNFRTILQECRQAVTEVLERLEWSQGYLMEKSCTPVQCPQDADHLMAPDSMPVHSAVCQLMRKGLGIDEAKDFVNTPAPSPDKIHVKIDQKMLNGILSQYYLQNHGTGYVRGVPVPVSHEEATMLLTPSERLAVHEFVVESLKKQRLEAVQNIDKNLLLNELKTDDNEEGEAEMTLLEQRAASRDYKRRRQSYRAKNVHTSSKSYIEVIREVISNQMELLQPVVRDPDNPTAKQTEEWDRQTAKQNEESGRRKTRWAEELDRQTINQTEESDTRTGPTEESEKRHSLRDRDSDSDQSPSVRSKHRHGSTCDSPDERRKRRKSSKHKHHKHKRHKSDKHRKSDGE